MLAHVPSDKKYALLVNTKHDKMTQSIFLSSDHSMVE